MKLCLSVGKYVRTKNGQTLASIPMASVPWVWHFSSWAMACCAFRLHGQRCVWVTWWHCKEFSGFRERGVTTKFQHVAAALATARSDLPAAPACLASYCSTYWCLGVFSGPHPQSIHSINSPLIRAEPPPIRILLLLCPGGTELLLIFPFALSIYVFLYHMWWHDERTEVSAVADPSTCQA